MKPFLTFFTVLPLLIVTPGCEEDFDMNAPYQDITVVFGLVDPSEDTIFLKINKAFLGEGNALIMAQIQDSSSYVNGLQAVIEEWENNTMMRSYTMDTITIKDKESGIFYNPFQIIYYTPYQPNTSREYRLKIQVKDKEVTGKTTLVRNFSIIRPSAGSAFIMFKPGNEGEVRWNSALNGRRYEVMIRFKYKEVFLDSPDTVFRNIDWAMGTRKSINTSGGEEMFIQYKNNSFYAIINNRVPYEDPAKEARVAARYTNNVDFFVAVAAEELNTYMEVNEPSNSIIQDRPDFTNITNGLGIFSSRYLNIREKKIHPETLQDIRTLAPELKFVY
ncbi:MAG: DUF4249 family protein [Bacteroidales bacterium]|nr:DUF4249 family protein [Bacteroidales bacterium]